MTEWSNQDAAEPVFNAVRMADLGAAIAAGDFGYCARIVGAERDRRAAPRRRTRLRSGKILDQDNFFLIECQIYDRSDKGVRVRLLANIPAQSTIRIYEDSPERLLDARVVWRNENELGLCFVRHQSPRRIGVTALTCLRGRYYAIDD